MPLLWSTELAVWSSSQHYGVSCVGFCASLGGRGLSATYQTRYHITRDVLQWDMFNLKTRLNSTAALMMPEIGGCVTDRPPAVISLAVY